MAYDRFDRDERSRWSEDRNDRNWRGDNRPQDFRGRDERGFWDRASDEVASWFGDDDAERRRRQDARRDERFGDGDRSRTTSSRDYDRGYGRDFDRDRDRSSFGGSRSDRDFNYDRGVFNRGGSSDRDFLIVNGARGGGGMIENSTAGETLALSGDITTSSEALASTKRECSSAVMRRPAVNCVCRASLVWRTGMGVARISMPVPPPAVCGSHSDAALAP